MTSTRQFKKATKKDQTVASSVTLHNSEPLYGKNKKELDERDHHIQPTEEAALNNAVSQPSHLESNNSKLENHQNSHTPQHAVDYRADKYQHSYEFVQNVSEQKAKAHSNNHGQHDHAHHNHSHSHAQHAHAHHNHGHSHAQHDHVLHNHGHNHSHTHSHDHSSTQHGHGHDHNHHGHTHFNHSHGHNHEHAHNHSHEHAHRFSPVYTPPLPSWVHIFSTLVPEQKTIFTWFLIHLCIGFCLYCLGTSRECLSLVGFGYLMIFDALGVLNTFVSSILRTQPAFNASNTKRPYGAHRYEIVFALGTTIYLLFATMNNTKESLEHFLLQDQHHLGELHHNEGNVNSFSFGIFLLIGAAISATCLSSISLRNHESFVRYLRRRPTTVQGFTYNVINRARASPLSALSSNIYSLSIVLCGVMILFCYLFGVLTPFIDKTVALSESCVMFYLGFPTASALAKVLLQTTPKSIQSGVENRLREIQQHETNVISVDKIHFWQTTYGKCVGTLEVRIRPEADEQAILETIFQKLEGLTNNLENNSQSELTVCITKY